MLNACLGISESSACEEKRVYLELGEIKYRMNAKISALVYNLGSRNVTDIYCVSENKKPVLVR